VGDTRIVTAAIQTNAKISIATMAGIATTGLAGQGPFPAAIVTMSGSSHLQAMGLILKPIAD
jgi:hypothetical protein